MPVGVCVEQHDGDCESTMITIAYEHSTVEENTNTSEGHELDQHEVTIRNYTTNVSQLLAVHEPYLHLPKLVPPITSA